jgi:RES domain-containing protein
MAQDFPALLSGIELPDTSRLRLRRSVPQTSLESHAPPDYLFASGRPNRYNPRGVSALYVSENFATMGAEMDRAAKSLGLDDFKNQVVYTVQAEAKLLDLANPKILTALSLGPTALHEPWKFALTPTETQQLGAAISGQTRFAGIRYPSDAAQEAGFLGYNIVIFKAAVVPPYFVSIKDDTGKEIQRWP